MEHPTVLVFLEFPDPQFPTDGFLDNFLYPDVELVGSYQVADDETVEQARETNETPFTATLREQAERFERQGIRTDTDLVFNRDVVETRRRIAEADDADAVLLPGKTHTLGEVLLPLRDLRNAAKKADMLDVIDNERLLKLELLHVTDPTDTTETDPKELLREAENLLVEHGIPRDKIETSVRGGDDMMFELSRAAASYDLAMLGESQRDIEERIFGPVANYVADNSDVSVMIVR